MATYLHAREAAIEHSRRVIDLLQMAQNNLGGTGPQFDPTAPYIKLRSVTTDRQGRSVAMKIFNCSEYYAPRAQRNQNRLIHGMFSINLRPIFDEFASDDAAAQALVPSAEHRRMFDVLFSDTAPRAWHTRYMNQVSLFFMFTAEDGSEAPIELEE